MRDRLIVSKGPSRREFLGGIAALGAGMAVSRCSGTEPGASMGAASATAAPVARRLIDVHHHFASPAWIKALSEYGVINRSWEGFTTAKDIELMDAAGVDVAFVSQTTPGVWLADGLGSNVAGNRVRVRQTIEQARALTREMNEFGARMRSDHPTRFGVFAALALPDIDGSLREIEYALDTLKLQGFGIMTSHGSKWIGDPVYEPIWEELNRRGAVVYTHPTAAPCCRDLLPGVGETTLEYGTDTARAIVSWIMSGSAKKFPNIKWIHSHGGGTLSGMTGRLLGDEVQYLRGEAPPDSRLHYIRQYYYDTRHIDNWAAAPVLKRMVGASQLVFGYFDIPRDGAGFDGPKEFQKLVDTGEFAEQDLDGIAHGNILRLFPGYARVET